MTPYVHNTDCSFSQRSQRDLREGLQRCSHQTNSHSTCVQVQSWWPNPFLVHSLDWSIAVLVNAASVIKEGATEVCAPNKLPQHMQHAYKSNRCGLVPFESCAGSSRLSHATGLWRCAHQTNSHSIRKHVQIQSLWSGSYRVMRRVGQIKPCYRATKVCAPNKLPQHMRTSPIAVTWSLSSPLLGLEQCRMSQRSQRE